MSLAFGSVLILLAGCTAIVDADQRKLGPSPVPCDRREPPLTCVCIDGTPSVQTCNALGRYDPCRCPGAAGSGAKPTAGSGGAKPAAGSGAKPTAGSGGAKPAAGTGAKPTAGSGGAKPTAGSGAKK
ncbi:MAG TPA: hypothetical protein VJV78_07025 [Polyangiales bacterium]|nr:hypothetical protein [Polyangiales bacterium]